MVKSKRPPIGREFVVTRYGLPNQELFIISPSDENEKPSFQRCSRGHYQYSKKFIDKCRDNLSLLAYVLLPAFDNSRRIQFPEDKLDGGKRVEK